jgi:hypothetical protein
MICLLDPDHEPVVVRALAHWHAYLNDPTLADAILEGVIHAAHKLTLAGESLRKQEPAK